MNIHCILFFKYKFIFWMKKQISIIARPGICYKYILRFIFCIKNQVLGNARLDTNYRYMLYFIYRVEKYILTTN